MRTSEVRAEARPHDAAVAVDTHREFVFPNRVRELRRRAGLPTLLGLSERLSEIPYIRLSKIERGEVFARAGELRAIAASLGVAPEALLLDVDAPGFDIARWAEPFRDQSVDPGEMRFAIKLAAALKLRRAGDRALTVAALERDYGIPPVILSRLENAQKPLDRWNAATVQSLCRLLGVDGPRALRAEVEARFRTGALDGVVGTIADPAARMAKTRARIAALRAELGGAPAAETAKRDQAPPPAPADETVAARLLPVLGAPAPGGLIDPAPQSGPGVEAPAHAGPRAFALRVCRPTLGPGLPGHGVVVADPDVWPAAGGLAVLREAEGYRLVSIGFDRNGAMRGISLNPDLDIPLDARDPADIAAVLAVIFR
jgi:transcriptional regulator with XRE-family HTH domain